MNQARTTDSIASPAASLAGVYVGLREDLEVSRHVFRGEVSYIVRDPMTFQTQRLGRADYEIFVHIHAGSSLAAVFSRLVEEGKLQQADEDRFYWFVVQLHRLGFLRLPVADDKVLYDRYRRRLRMKRMERTLGFMFLRIPLWNPDAFLGRTVHLVRPFFTIYAFLAWLLMMASAGLVAWQHAVELAEPINGVLLAGNLPLLWVCLVGLKVLHEFGHAYACKHFGGHMPEMGAYLILFTPCAYVDATASWGFARKLHRIVVCAGGMYVESVIAAASVFVWVATGPSLINSVAYNVMFLASAVTVLFNANPLMRYDGYYMLADWLEIPNLRQRSMAAVHELLKRVFLGLRTQSAAGTRRLAWILVAFGGAAGAYRVMLVVAIAAALAARFRTAGLAIGVLMVGTAGFVLLRKLIRYLWHAEETAPVRVRAVALGLVLFVVLPAALFWMPIQGRVRAAGVVAAEREMVIRPTMAGTLEQLSVQPGMPVRAGQVVARLHSDDPKRVLLEAQAGLAAIAMRADAYRAIEPARVNQELDRFKAAAAAVNKAKADQHRLTLTAPLDGKVVSVLDERAAGSYLAVGSSIATIIAGRPLVRVILTEDQLARAQLEVGDRVEFRCATDAGRAIPARVALVAPAGSRLLDARSLTQAGTQDVAIDQSTGRAQQPYFEVLLEVVEVDAALRYGATGYASFPAEREPLGRDIGRRLLRFWDKLMQG